MSNQLPLDAYWMPYTGNRQFKRDPRIIVAAQDVWFTDDQGRRILDGHSGLWTSGLGHGHPEVSKAVAEQIETLDFAPPFQFGHPAAFQLADRLRQLMPGDLNYVKRRALMRRMRPAPLVILCLWVWQFWIRLLYYSFLHNKIY